MLVQGAMNVGISAAVVYDVLRGNIAGAEAALGELKEDWLSTPSKFHRVSTHYGIAIQSESAAALNARLAVEDGAWLYRGGKLGRSAGPEGQFWSLESPLSPGYAKKYGIPIQNVKFDFIELAVAKPGSSFITRESPGIGVNRGGGIDVVVNAGEPKLQYFHMPWELENDSFEQRIIPKN